MKRAVYITGIVFLLCIHLNGYAQVSLSETPPRVYFTEAPGATGSQQIRVDNMGKKPLEVGVSLGDWDYDSLGNNRAYETGTLKTSCAKWLQVLPGSYFTVPPGGRQYLTVKMNVPADADKGIAVHTAMLYLTQLNADDSKQKNGASLKVRVEMGVKIYHSFSGADKPSMEIANFQDTILTRKDKKTAHALYLQLKNTGRLWVEGNIKWELLNEQNGKTTKLNDINVFSLPGDKRYIMQPLPENMPKGKYSATAIVNYGDKNDLKIAELEFMY